MDGEKLERRERDFWESEKETRGRESGCAGRHNVIYLQAKLMIYNIRSKLEIKI